MIELTESDKLELWLVLNLLEHSHTDDHERLSRKVEDLTYRLRTERKIPRVLERTIRKMSFDPKCYELGAMFLEDLEDKFESYEDLQKARDQLAQSIQNTIEGFLSHLEFSNE